jgi:radical SAM protein with 4Fe4S-binding SPASM domain
MTASGCAELDCDWRDHERAVALLTAGDVPAGTRLLGDIARRTTHRGLRSKCAYNLGEVLERLGDTDAAYRTYYPIAHKPAGERNDFDQLARVRVMVLFQARGLRVTPPDFPPKVQVEITNRCNLRCVMCTRNRMTRPLGDMSFETLLRIADECSHETGCLLSLFYLGESLLHRDLDRMIEYLASVRLRSPVPMAFGIQTNGTLLTKERSRALLSAGLREIGISLDALGETLEQIRPGAHYDRIEQNIHDLLAVADELHVGDLVVHISKLCDDPQTPEVQAFARRWHGPRTQVHLMPVTKIEGLAYLAGDGSIRQVGPKEHAPPRGYCGEGTRLLVHWNGDFGFCCADIDGELKLGNIRDRSIREVWNSAEMRRIRNKITAAEYTGLDACLKCPQSYRA